MDLFAYVGKQIRDLRLQYANGSGISQDALAKEIGVTPNTISRWETATYRPSLADLEKLARFFGVSILKFFPSDGVTADSKIDALLRAAKQLPDEDIDELRRYAEFRRAGSLYNGGRKLRPGRKTKGAG
jgi:transcriptional regulator with XRE-family HTH domain